MFATTYVVFNLWMAYLMFAVAMILIAMRMSPLQALMTSLVPSEQRGILLSLAMAVGQLGFGIGTALAGLTFITYGYLSNTALAATSIILMALLVLFFLPEPTNPATLLKRTALFQHLDDEALARLASQAEVVTLEAGRYLFRQGDPGESFYVIVRGTAEVVFEAGADSHTIDDHGYGEVVGEMALLTGEPRNASIRATTLLRLVRIGQAALHELMQSSPDVREAIWSAFSARRFDNYLRGLRRFEHLRPETRRDWIAGRPQVVLEPGTTFVPEPETAYLFLVTGEVEIEQNGVWVAMRAPALAECGASVRLHSLSATRLIPLPARENEDS